VNVGEGALYVLSLPPFSVRRHHYAASDGGGGRGTMVGPDDVHEQVCARGYPGGSEHLTVVHVQDFRVYLD
jgi:hypothetical protein